MLLQESWIELPLFELAVRLDGGRANVAVLPRPTKAVRMPSSLTAQTEAMKTELAGRFVTPVAVTVTVDSENPAVGVVTITGTVKSAAERDKVGDLARSQPGVKDVVNSLEVKPNTK